ncbi:SDR family NAD(P)-dependent oxidoreductase [Cellulomonas sp. SG140]|uniref:SDR family NAD(P)-dependent oxidoreductase n=1 Tax=Cellulomonas sp. SG140 TaxID=2976536 RepID=UPI0021E7B02E|nr:SDR family NAD(P)-dependent oxidoreductase [Cellulomonas sp. SG140]
MTTTLITGGNKGLGRETARQLLALGHDVWIGARDAERGRRAADELGARLVQLDVTDDASVAAAAATVGELDVLVNNAGVSGGLAAPADVTADVMRTVFDTNVFGVVRVTRAFLPALQRSTDATVVNVSSGLGSMTLATDPASIASRYQLLAYSSAKAAVNMVTVQYAKAFPQLRVNSVDPGFTATDFNGHRGVQTVEEGARAIVRAALLGRDGPTGTFFDHDGTVPW